MEVGPIKVMDFSPSSKTFAKVLVFYGTTHSYMMIKVIIEIGRETFRITKDSCFCGNAFITGSTGDPNTGLPFRVFQTFSFVQNDAPITAKVNSLVSISAARSVAFH
ncbi:hypothetical protein [Parasphingorhabdus sp.]|uniref:hypothetical protein n=1 Tax=Parasphingorhabdus sp. TaxID=2709688 RepID=UPI003A95557A